jgi:chromosomal replication initiator protein
MITWDELRRVVCEVCNTTPAALASPLRTQRMANARTVCVWIARRHFRTVPSYPWVGRQLGGRDHTTMMHSEKRAVKCADLIRECCERLGVSCDL